jgi:hypothetical protein
VAQVQGQQQEALAVDAFEAVKHFAWLVLLVTPLFNHEKL